MEYGLQEIENEIAKQRGLEDEQEEDEQLALASIEEKPKGLTKLTHRHELIALLYANGVPSKKIAERVGVTHQYVNWIVKDPLVEAEIERHYSYLDAEFKALYRDVITSIRTRLRNEDPDVQTKAVDQYLKAHGRYNVKAPEQPSTSAEDVVREILELRIIREQKTKKEQTPTCPKNLKTAEKAEDALLLLPVRASAGA